jgi:hypothetical protein
MEFYEKIVFMFIKFSAICEEKGFSQLLQDHNVIIGIVYFNLFIFNIILIHILCLIFLHFVSILNINNEESKEGSQCSAEEGGCLLW